jgi:hypothetical protein
MRFVIENCPIELEFAQDFFSQHGLPVKVEPAGPNLCRLKLCDRNGLLIPNRDSTAFLYRFSRPVVYLLWMERDGLSILSLLALPHWADDESLIRLIRHLDKRGPKWASIEARQLVGEALFTRIQQAEAQRVAHRLAQVVGQALEHVEEPQAEEERPEDKPN